MELSSAEVGDHFVICDRFESAITTEEYEKADMGYLSQQDSSTVSTHQQGHYDLYDKEARLGHISLGRTLIFGWRAYSCWVVAG